MSQLNKKKVINGSVNSLAAQAKYGLGVSANGNVQFKKGPMNILFESLVTTLYGKDSFYESGNDKVKRMKNALTQVVERDGIKGAEFAGRAALFAREHMYIRTMPIVMVVELAKLLQDRNLKFVKAVKEINEALEAAVKTKRPVIIDLTEVAYLYDGMSADLDTHAYGKKPLTIDELRHLRQSLTANPPSYNIRQLVCNVISRVDELTDLYAYALTVFKENKKVPMSIKRGVADAFNKFDTYQFGKYNRKDGLTLRNLLRIVHPTPKNEDSSGIFKKIMDEALESPYTWEVELSRNGQLPPGEKKSNKQLWTELITREGSGSLGYMAMIRNLRNMREAGIDDSTWKLVASRISNPKAVAKSKQLPFGFINAYDIAKESKVPSVVLNALQEATELSLANMPKLGERVWIILDCSGSMGGMMLAHCSLSPSMLSSYSSQTNVPIKVGAIFAAALSKASKDSFDFKFTMFDNYAKYVELNPRDSVFTNYEKIMSRSAGGGTNLQSAFNSKSELGFEPDTVIVLSDMEVNRLSSHNADKIFSKDCVKVAINLNSRDTTPLAEWKGWIQLSGWSPKIFQFVEFTRNADSIVQLLCNNAIPLSGQSRDSEED